MAFVDDTPHAPMLANIVVIVGFISVFTTFATESPASWILGVLLIVSGGIWAGFAGGTSDQAPDQTDGPSEPAAGGQSHGGAH